MSLVSDLLNAIDQKINSYLPDYALSRYIWDYTRNGKSSNKNFYAVRPSQANFISGTCNTITLEQDYEIELGTEFRNPSDNDSDINNKILELYSAHQELYLQMMRDNFNIGRVQVVSGLNLNSPEIDLDNKVCKIVATYTIKYRTE